MKHPDENNPVVCWARAGSAVKPEMIAHACGSEGWRRRLHLDFIIRAERFGLTMIC
jgi:hypothetical protein